MMIVGDLRACIFHLLTFSYAMIVIEGSDGSILLFNRGSPLPHHKHSADTY